MPCVVLFMVFGSSFGLVAHANSAPFTPGVSFFYFQPLLS